MTASGKTLNFPAGQTDGMQAPEEGKVGQDSSPSH